MWFALLFLGAVHGASFSVDLSATPSLFNHLWESSVGSCHATTALRQDWRAQLSTVKKDIGFQMVRFHGILDDDMSVVLSDGSYSFFNIDSIFDFLVSINMKPYIELSFMPESYASGSQTVFHYKGNISPPKNYNDWNRLISTLATHLISRYGADVVRSWYFEVWNEPNCGFFYQCCCCGNTGCGNQTAYFQLYQNTANALKSVDKGLRVGGPSTAQLGWITEFINFVKTNNVPVDFVSSHLYPTDPQTVKDANGFGNLILNASNQCAQSNLPFLLTEYNPGLGLGVADEPYSASFLVHTANQLSGPSASNLAAYSYWTFSDIFEEGGQNPNPFYDGFGAETIYSIAKPVYRAFQLLHQLSTSRLSVSNKDSNPVDVIATIQKINSTASSLHLLSANFNYITQPISPQSVVITLSSTQATLPATANIRRIDDTHANPIPVWKNAGSPTYPSADLIKQMDTAAQIVVEQVPITSLGGGQYSISFNLPNYGVADIEVPIQIGLQ